MGRLGPPRNRRGMQQSRPVVSEAGRLALAAMLGQSQAFGVVAGRCSAAQAACLHRLRHTREFQAVTSRWREFCSNHLGISGRTADKIVRLWGEFGAAYFELAQLTGIPPGRLPRPRPRRLRWRAPPPRRSHRTSPRELPPPPSTRSAAPFPRPNRPANLLPTNGSPLSTNAPWPSSPSCKSSPPQNEPAKTACSSPASSRGSPPPSTASRSKTAYAKSGTLELAAPPAAFYSLAAKRGLARISPPFCESSCLSPVCAVWSGHPFAPALPFLRRPPPQLRRKCARVGRLKRSVPGWAYNLSVRVNWVTYPCRRDHPRQCPH